MKKRAIIVHCWGGSPDYAWYPWVKGELEKRGYTVQVPQMPHTDEPRLNEWLPTLQKLAGDADIGLLLIGHSLGTVTIMRYLENLPEGQQVGKVILVAGFTDPLGFADLENFFETRLNFRKISDKSAGGFTVIQSDNDPYIAEQYGNRLENELSAELVLKRGAGHMSGAVDGEESCTELPEIVEAVGLA